RKRDLLRPGAHARAERTRGLDPDVTRRGRKEDEADQVGAGGERHIERLGRLQAADFDQDGHCRDRSPARFYIGADLLSRLASPLLLQENSRGYAAGGWILSRGAASPGAPCATGALGPGRRWRRSTSARSSRACASACRAARRHLPCLSQAALPPTTTPPIKSISIRRQSGRARVKAGWAWSNGSKEATKLSRFATAKLTTPT